MSLPPCTMVFLDWGALYPRSFKDQVNQRSGSDSSLALARLCAFASFVRFTLRYKRFHAKARSRKEKPQSKTLLVKHEPTISRKILSLFSRIGVQSARS